MEKANCTLKVKFTRTFYVFFCIAGNIKREEVENACDICRFERCKTEDEVFSSVQFSFAGIIMSASVCDPVLSMFACVGWFVGCVLECVQLPPRCLQGGSS